MTADDLIEAEAKRRCISAGYTLEYLACQDRRFAHDDRRPWWRAMFCSKIRGEIDALEKAGFTVVTSSLAAADARWKEQDKMLAEAADWLNLTASQRAQELGAKITAYRRDQQKAALSQTEEGR